MLIWKTLSAGLAGVALVAAADRAVAEVERLEIVERVPVADGRSFGTAGAYELVRGKLYYAVSPDDKANAAIVDLGLAPRDARGRVTFQGDFALLRPVDGRKDSGTLLYEVNNRGNVYLLNLFNDAPLQNDLRQPETLGDGWLLEQGHSLLWSAWNWDVVPGAARQLIELPAARNPDGSPITGKVAYEFTVNAPTRAASYLGILAKGYPFADPAGTDAVLTVRDAPDGPRTVIPREDWRFGKLDGEVIVPDTTSIVSTTDFVPGRLYELVYTARDPKVLGLGIAAVRDTLSFFRYAGRDAAGTPSPLIDKDGALPKRTLAFGISQSGRLIQTQLLHGLHVDERGRPVFDGAFIHVAGGGKGGFNFRFAQTTRHFSPYEETLYPTDYFPFATVATTDPATGETGSVLDRAKALGVVPKLIYTATSTDYWARAASLLHTDPEGRKDVALDPDARLFLLTGSQHVVYTAAARGIYENCLDPLDHRPQLRALLVALDRWSDGRAEPPASRHPAVADGTLTNLSGYLELAPTVPGLRRPQDYLKPARLDLGPRFASAGIADIQPPKVGAAYGTLVPTPDQDGNDRAGLRPPELTAPVGSYLPWNLRNTQAGAPERLARLFGSFVPFAPTEAARKAASDPRPSLAERYGSRDAYVAKVDAAAWAAVADGTLLDRDRPKVVARAAAFYDRVAARDPADRSCAYLAP